MKLTNFGAAYSELKGRLRTPPGLLRGDPAYIAPEILHAFREPIGLGKLANRVLRFGPGEVARASEEVPEPLRRIVARALRTHPADRYPRAAELRDDLRGYLRGLRRPYGAAEAARELTSLLKAASSRKRLDATSIERGVLPTPEEKARLQNLIGRGGHG